MLYKSYTYMLHDSINPMFVYTVIWSECETLIIRPELCHNIYICYSKIVEYCWKTWFGNQINIASFD